MVGGFVVGSRFCLWVLGFGVVVFVLGSSRRCVTRVSSWHPKVRPCDHVRRKMPHADNYIYIAVLCCGCVIVVIKMTIIISCCCNS